MDDEGALAVAAFAAEVGAASAFEGGFHHGNPVRRKEWKKRSHFELNGIEVENVPRGGDGRDRVGEAGAFGVSFHHGNPEWRKKEKTKPI